ncbi:MULTISPECIES: hypothetical protein [unclassified Pantoea]|uniref:hypothetical protein n=1 Tax=unclassified Pantoea TaxID=2630326 RepID=UPI00123283DE|nr:MULTISPECIES: hypothetical protein [unclassified Pantoea]KAA5974841.1 hypothetical protein F3I51_02825 [Pantoea sp. M_6]KAA5979196.1 hypothetical protein F3I52_04390 [Pantoea sp. M_8]KAA5992030.1 hypothetical protein F3I47_09225 [Pantoea sp. M_10]
MEKVRVTSSYFELTQSIAAIVAGLSVKIEQDCGNFLPHICPMGQVNIKDEPNVMSLSRLISSPRVIFLVLISACFIAVAGSFLSWNKAKSFSVASLQNVDSADLKYSIDSCSVNKDFISAKGWMFSSDYPKSGSLIVTINSGNGEFVLPSFTFTRGDVSQLFARTDLFDKVGFNASISGRMISFGTNPTFNFYIKDKNGNVKKALSYACNK